ncbi:hypothetical protein GQ44DRAFT_755720 [Phaeosphaeriaceae sp. PMI808]|nr:hypothetical protein GQ44DRAFT_755720 [Phaeosphaeriaceae sp. PMI808]
MQEKERDVDFSDPLNTHQSSHTNSFQQPHRNSHKQPRRKTKSKVKDKDMAGLPKSPFVPLHLRKRTTEVAVTKESPGHSPATGSSTHSSKSKAKFSGKIQSSPRPHLTLRSTDTNLPHSPPTTTQNSVRGEVQAKKSPVQAKSSYGSNNDRHAEYVGWDVPTPTPVAPPNAPKYSNPRWPRANEPRKKRVWPKYSDMKPLPSDENSDDGGVTFQSNSNGDPEYDVKKLMAWNGDWMPPPEEWANRKGYTARNFGRGVEAWMNGHSKDCYTKIDHSVLLSTVAEDSNCKEVVPRYWITPRVGHESTAEFWRQFAGRAPAPLSDIDIEADPPFWERMEDETSHFINALKVPDARVDPEDAGSTLNGIDLLVSAAVRVEGILERRRKAILRKTAKQSRVVPERVYPVPQVDDNRIRPTSNIYLRPVQPADVVGIAAIYNYYVEHTIHANEFKARTEEHIRNRIDTTIKAGLPFLVAIARGNRPRGPKGYVSDRVVGYISLDEYCGPSSMYRYTFDMDLYVHPGYVCHKIAKCLLDKLLEMCNTGYNARGGYEYRNEYEYLKYGPTRVIKTIMLTVHIENGEKDTTTYEYLKPFGFSRGGHIRKIAYKFGKVVDACFFSHETTETINPNSVPNLPSELE